MLSDTLRATIDALAEQCVMTDPKDLPELAQLHSLLEEAVEQTHAAGVDTWSASFHEAAELVSSIILEEVEDPAPQLQAFSDFVARCQNACQTEANPDEIVAAGGWMAVEDTGKKDDAPDLDVLLEVFEASPGDMELLGDFIAEALEHLENAEVSLLDLEANPEDEESINAIFRAFHTIKGCAGMLKIASMQHFAHEAENLLDKVRKGEVRVHSTTIDAILKAIDCLKKMMDELSVSLASDQPLTPDPQLPTVVQMIREVVSGNTPAADSSLEEEADAPPKPLGDMLLDSGAATHEDIVRALYQQLEEAGPKKIGEILVRQNKLSSAKMEQALEEQRGNPDQLLGEILLKHEWVSLEDIQEALSRQEEEPVAPKLGEILVRKGSASAREVSQAIRKQSAATRTTGKLREVVKVDSERLDRLVDMIGELVIAQSMAPKSDMDNSSALERDHLDQLERIIRELQETGMSLRMIPLTSTFQKMARLVRDLARNSGKRVDFSVSGKDTELDKTVVDKIGDPLIHMIRNAVDHGLEASVEERREAGKEDVGHVSLRAFHQQGSLFIEIEDDGRGLDRTRIIEKAVSKGLIRDGSGMSDEEVWNLIFEPGFSTAKQITDVSGRGVGMDVVRRGVESMRGQVSIQSTLGKGTIFTIRLPLTLAIIDGMVVQCGAERYIIPTLSIRKSIRATTENITTMLGKGEVVVQEEEVIPLLRLSRLFSIPGEETDITHGFVVLVESNRQTLGIHVDRLLGQQQIVIKPLGDIASDAQGISGGAIMPDGNVSMIIDVEGLLALSPGLSADEVA